MVAGEVGDVSRSAAVCTEAREAVLASVRDALAAGRAGPPAAEDGASAAYRLTGERDRTVVLELLAERCADYGALVRRVAAAEVGQAVADSLAAAGADRVAVPSGLPPAWLAAPVAWLEDGDGPVERLLEVDGALTGCALAIAETGTIVLDGGARQGRRALTLVPDYHLCVVFAEQVVELVPEAMERLRSSAEAGLPVTFVSGCSATSDIELERVAGVHGPRTLELILVMT